MVLQESPSSYVSQRSDGDKCLFQALVSFASLMRSQESKKSSKNCPQEYPILRTLYKSNHHVFSTWHPHINGHVNREIMHDNEMATLNARLRELAMQMAALNQQLVQAQ